MKKAFLTVAITAIAQFTYAQFSSSGGSTYTMDIVGIGTSTPATALDVYTSSGTTQTNIARFNNSTNGHYTTFTASGSSSVVPTWTNASQILEFVSGTSGKGIIDSYQSPLVFQTSREDRMTISTNGNIGIGTSNPAYKLGLPNDATISFNQDPTNPFGIEGGDHAQTRVIMGAASGAGSNIAFGVSGGAGYNSFTEKMRINSVGNVGIGTTNPIAKLQLGEFNGSPNHLLIPGTYNFEQVRLGQISNGNSALEFVNHTGVGASYGVKLLVDVDNGLPGLQLQYAPSTNSYGSLNYTTGLYMNLSGNILIGKTSQANPNYKLDVNGSARVNEVVVNSTGADFVFEPEYNLPKLSDVKDYIDQNHHLPEIPSAAEMQKNGMNIGELNTKLLQKVEELTLYLIEQQKINQSLQKQIDQLAKNK